MKNSTKAVLISAFVFPGAGHLFLKQYIQGILLTIASLSAFYLLITKSVEMALAIVEKIKNGEVQQDVMAITDLISKQTAGNEAQILDMATLTITVCWIIGIADSYRIAHRQDKEKGL